MTVGNWLAALCFARFPRATRASRATNPRPSGFVALVVADRRQSYVRGVELSRESPKLAVVGKKDRYRELLKSCDTRWAGKWS